MDNKKPNLLAKMADSKQAQADNSKRSAGKFGKKIGRIYTTRPDEHIKGFASDMRRSIR